MLENVALKKQGNHLIPDYFDTSKTENGRVSYPIFHIDNYHEPQMAGHPKNIIFLSCDAFGVLPPIAKLSPEQAMVGIARLWRGSTQSLAYLTLFPFIVPLHFWLHGEGRWHREGDHRTYGNFQCLLRGCVLDAQPYKVRRTPQGKT